MSKSTNVHGYYHCRWAEKGVYSGWKDTLGFKLLPMSVPSHHSEWQERRWRSWWSPWWWWWSWTPRTSLAPEGPPSSRRAFMSLGLPAGTARLISHKRSIIYNYHRRAPFSNNISQTWGAHKSYFPTAVGGRGEDKILSWIDCLSHFLITTDGVVITPSIWTLLRALPNRRNAFKKGPSKK